jgi:hypothetical protein
MLYRVVFTLVSKCGNEIRCQTEWSTSRDTALMFDRLIRNMDAIDISIQAKDPADL